MKKLLVFIGVLAMIGCARFSTTQMDQTISTNGTQRIITTKANAGTFFSAKSQLANWKATQTDKTQGASVGSLVQEGGQTNQVSDLVGAAVGAAVKAAVMAK